jgi:hypothetical protein
MLERDGKFYQRRRQLDAGGKQRNIFEEQVEPLGNTFDCIRLDATSFSETSDPAHHRIAIAAHHALRVGTLNSIVRSVAQHKAYLGMPFSILSEACHQPT